MKNISSKILKNGFLTAAGLLVMSSCSRDLTSLNIDPKHPSSVPSGNLLATGQYNEFYYMYSSSVNDNNYRFFDQYWSETTYTQESNYDLVSRHQPRHHFNEMYTYALNSFEQAKKNLPSETNDAASAANKWAVLELSELFVFENLVDTFGNVPYSQALQAATVKSPAYDDARSIYTDLFKRIDAAVSKINTSAGGYTNEDLVYSGDMTKWIKFANSLKLRLAMNLADVDPSTSKAEAEAAIAAGTIDSDASSYSLVFDGGTFTNPMYDDLVSSGRNDFVPSDALVNTMNGTSDPRRPAYFTTVDGQYIGGAFGQQNPFGYFSHISTTFTQPNSPAKLMSYTEVAFLKAEAAARGYNTGGTAATLFATAVNASMAENGVSASDATAYLAANPYNASSWKTSIGNEAWVALWNSPFAAWNFNRRLDSPALVAPAGNFAGGLPVRMPYSDQEYVVNNANVAAAAAAIGGDKAITHLFWDKY